MFLDQLRETIAGARSGRALDDLARKTFAALGAGALDDDAAHQLLEAVQARRLALANATSRPAGGAGARPDGRRSIFPVRRPQRSPDRARSIERRRRLAASGPLPPALAGAFTTGEAAALRIVGDEARERGDCRLPLAAIAARAGISRSTAQRALREAERLGLLVVVERRRPGRVSLTNVVRIVSREWGSWLAKRVRAKGEGIKSETPRKFSSLSGWEAKGGTSRQAGDVERASAGGEIARSRDRRGPIERRDERARTA